MSGKQNTFVVLLVISCVLALPFLLFAGWCLYDGLVTCPLRLDQYQAYIQLQQTHPDTYPQEWTALAAASGWPNNVPRRTISADVTTQYIMSGLCGFIGLLCAVCGIVSAILFQRSNRKLAEQAHRNLTS